MKCPNCNEYVPDNNYICPHCSKIMQPDKDPSDYVKKPIKLPRLTPNLVIVLIIVVGIIILAYATFYKGKTGEEAKKAPSPSIGTEVGQPASGPASESAVEPSQDAGSDSSAETDAEADSAPDGDATSEDASSPAAASVGGVINAANPGEEIDIEGFIQEGKTTIFDFYSEYCPPCRRISPLLEQLDSRRDDIIVCKVDINRPGIQGIDWGSPLSRQYKLGSIPHFRIYDTSGNLVLQDNPAYQEVLKLLKEEGLIQ